MLSIYLLHKTQQECYCWVRAHVVLAVELRDKIVNLEVEVLHGGEDQRTRHMSHSTATAMPKSRVFSIFVSIIFKDDRQDPYKANLSCKDFLRI
jgi:hypothetical protein